MVHDPQMNPNWEGSTADNNTGFRCSSMTKFSATLDKVEVKEIDLRSLLMSLTVGAFERGETSAIFQALGILHSEKEELRISATGAARISANSPSTQFGRSSGPPARAQLISSSLRRTEISVTVMG